MLAAVVLTAVYGLMDFPAMFRMWRVSRLDFYAATIALGAVLLLGILQGILLAALASILLLLARVSSPHVAFLGRVPGTNSYSDIERHPENEPAARRDRVSPRSIADLRQCRRGSGSGAEPASRKQASVIRLVVCDLSAAPYLDLAGSGMLHTLHAELAKRGTAFRVIGARGSVRDLLRADGVEGKIGRVGRSVTLESVLDADAGPPELTG